MEGGSCADSWDSCIYIFSYVYGFLQGGGFGLLCFALLLSLFLMFWLDVIDFHSTSGLETDKAYLPI